VLGLPKYPLCKKKITKIQDWFGFGEICKNTHAYTFAIFLKNNKKYGYFEN
jgi:hypothetical protein